MIMTKKIILILLSFIILFFGSFIFIKTNYVVIEDRMVSIRTKGIRIGNLDEEKARSLLRFKDLESLDIVTCDISNIDFLKYLPKLKYLTIDVRSIKDLSPIGNCTELQNLKLIGNEYGDLQFLSNCTKINHLEMYGKEYEDLQFLESLDSLKWLTISGSGLKDIEPLRQNNSIELIEIYSNDLEDISALRGKKKIIWLVICSKNLNDCSPLSSCTGLKSLSLSGCEKINNPEFINGLDKLEEIDLAGTSITNFEPLLNLKSLKKVTVTKGEVDNKIIKELKNNGVEVKMEDYDN